VLRVADVLVSDYATELIDFLVTDRPVVCFASDVDAVREDPGFVLDLDALMPGGVHRDPDSMLSALDAALQTDAFRSSHAYRQVRDVLHAYRDGRCARRVVRRVQATYLPIAPRLRTPDAPPWSAGGR
jgi:CDP-glycerol glycerophosphotransferase